MLGREARNRPTAAVRLTSIWMLRLESFDRVCGERDDANIALPHSSPETRTEIPDPGTSFSQEPPHGPGCCAGNVARELLLMCNPSYNRPKTNRGAANAFVRQ
jgi:hypothetical protein